MHCLDWEMDFTVDANYGIGIEFEPWAGCVAITEDDGPKPRVVTFEQSSFRGISVGASHWYGKLNIFYTLPFRILKCSTDSSWNVKVGELRHIMGTNNPPESDGLEINLTRILSKKEIEQYPKRWKYYEIGDYTECFNSPSAVTRAAKRVFNKVFEKGWNLIRIKSRPVPGENYWEDYEEILASSNENHT